MSQPRFLDLRRMSLRKKLLLPFFLVLVLVGAAATIGTVLYITGSLSRSVEKRLQAFQEVMYREIKQQEILLTTYANLFEYIQTSSDANAEAGLLHDQLFASLRDSRITVAIYPPGIDKNIPYESLRALLDQANRSGRPRFRLTTDFGSTPALTVAAPSRTGRDRRNTLVLQMPMDRILLHHLGSGFDVSPTLLSFEGKILVAGDNSPPPSLTPEELGTVLGGEPLFKLVPGQPSYKFLYRAIPLGTTDLVIAVAAAPLNDLGSIINTLTLRSALTFFFALLVGSILYYRLVRQVTEPVEELLNATRAISEGNLDYRIARIADGELGHLAQSFNGMMGQLKTIYEENLAREKALALAQEDLRFKDVVEEKNREIERTNEELRNHLAELSALFQLNQAMSTLDIGVLFERMVEVLRDVIHCQGMILLLYHPGNEELEVRMAVGIDSEFLQKTRFRVDGGVTGEAAQSQDLVYLADLEKDQPKLEYRGRSFPGGSLVCAPMVVKKRLAGILLLQKEAPRAFSETELRLIQAVTNQAAIAIENARLYESTRNLSNTDELTRLANRRYFQEILKRETALAQRFGTKFSLIMADIDHFKLYNDAHGHLSGDTALRMVADILLQNTRGIDLVARFGGEEFVILLPKTEKVGAAAAAEKLRQCIAETVFPGARKSQPGGCLTTSFGVAEFPTDSRDLFELLDRADRALYQAKETGRNKTVTWGLSCPRKEDQNIPPASSP